MSSRHLSANERMKIFYLQQYGCSLREIGRRLDRSHTTISRELKRNSRPYHFGYCDRFAQHQAESRKAIARHEKKFGYKRLVAYVHKKLALGWSPQIIANRMVVEYPSQSRLRVSHETIYQWIYHDARRGGDLYKHLVREHKRRRKQFRYGKWRSLIPHRVDIDQRPDSVNRRQHYGHWEGDTMVGAQRRGRIATHVERKSRFLLSRMIKDGTAELFNQASIQCFSAIPAQYRQTLTLDNGSENTLHEQLTEKLNMRIYFAKPYASWERGTNENTNGLLRRYFPKGTDFLKLTQKQLDKVVRLLNHRPRKCLNYQTPFEVFNRITGGALRA